MNIHNNHILIIFGPTGVGKTVCADLIAAQVPSEIINLDMGQLYTPLTIGTAKPDWQASPIPHHMFDVINEPRDYSVQQYRDAVMPIMQQIWQRNRLPIFVGGSGFYLRSLFFPPTAERAPFDFEHEDAPSVLWEQLHAIDQERANCIDRHDIYRIKRALAIWQATGKKPSEYVPHYEPIAPYTIICLERDRQELYARINTRVHEMIAEGWIAEVKELLGSAWESFILRKKIIGYDDIIHFLHGAKEEKYFTKMIGTIQKRTRHYAKRQMTYWRMLERDLITAHQLYEKEHGLLPMQLHEVSLTSTHLEEYINKLLIDINLK